MAESSSVQSLERAFDLLEKLCRSRNGLLLDGGGLRKSHFTYSPKKAGI